MTGELVDAVAGEMDESDAGEPDVDQDAITPPLADDVDGDGDGDGDGLTGWGVPLEGDTADVDEADDAPDVDVEVIAAAQREALALLLVVDDEPAKVRKARAAVAKTASAAAAAHLAIAKARDVVADTAGAVRVAEAKATEHLSDPRKTLAQSTAAEVALAKAQRAHARAVEALEQAVAAAAAADDNDGQLAIAKARDVVADTAGAVRAAEAKATKYLDEPAKTRAQRIAADVALAKAQRAHARAVGALERAVAAAAVADDVAAQARALLDDVLAAALAEALAAAALEEEQEEAAPPEPLFETLPEFVEQIIAVLYAAELATGAPRRWCGQWWRHPEVVFRLEAVWRAFEHLRLDATTGMSVFLRDHADPHMGVIMDADGPLRRCKPTDHQDPLSRLILVEPQDGLYTPENA